MNVEQKQLTIEDLKALIMGIQQDAEQANMPAGKHQMRLQLVQLRLQQLDSYTLVKTKDFEEQQKVLLDLELKEQARDKVLDNASH